MVSNWIIAISIELELRAKKSFSEMGSWLLHNIAQNIWMWSSQSSNCRDESFLWIGN